MDTTADFRSDTVTRPDPEMRRAMAEAEVGDDVMGEDPTVNALEREAAQFLGMEAAVFVPSGTMANQIAIHGHCGPGDEVICEERCHVFLYEAGGAARWSGAQVRPVAASTGFLSPAQVAAHVRVDDPHLPRSRLLVIENTHNMAGGRVLGRAGMAGLIAAAREHGLAVHVDGARLANAAVACGVPAAQLVAGVDSVSLCFSKALGAPVGSVVAGSASFAHEARRTRKALGGGMRQAGILAAPALLALRDGPARLAADHARARRTAEALADLSAVRVDPTVVETNILMVDIPAHEPEDLLRHLAEQRILAAQYGPHRVRFVFHRDLTDEHVDRCIAAISAWAGRVAS